MLATIVLVGRAAYSFSTRVYVEAPLGDVRTQGVYEGSVYNVGLTLDVNGPDEARVMSARALEVSPGLKQLPAMLGWGCPPAGSWATVVTANPQGLRNADFRPMGTSVRASDGACWYLLLRFDPERLGTLTATRVEVVYRVGRRTVRETIDFTYTLFVEHEGRDLAREE